MEQYIVDHGKVPNPSDFKKAGMPPHPVIKNKYKVTLKEWLEENYLNYGSLRHDVVTDRLQIRVADLHSLEDGSAYCLEFRGKENWRNLTDKDINTMVCQCVAEKGLNISTNEMWTALKSDMGPQYTRCARGLMD